MISISSANPVEEGIRKSRDLPEPMKYLLKWEPTGEMADRPQIPLGLKAGPLSSNFAVVVTKGLVPWRSVWGSVEKEITPRYPRERHRGR